MAGRGRCCVLLAPNLWIRKWSNPRTIATLITQEPRGTHDLVGDELRTHLHIGNLARQTALLWGCQEIRTPIFEYTSLFTRSFGQQSDVVNKEMYNFYDKSGKSVSLRPENTAGVVRAFVNKADYSNLPHRFFYNGPMFRYERPQKGRQRQFHQIGVEVLGSNSQHTDVEVIQMAAYLLWKKLGLGQDIVLHINSLGDDESRSNYKSSLRNYLETHTASLSLDSRERYLTPKFF
jgi:histidyl-tRNA synthetase